MCVKFSILNITAIFTLNLEFDQNKCLGVWFIFRQFDTNYNNVIIIKIHRWKIPTEKLQPLMQLLGDSVKDLLKIHSTFSQQLEIEKNGRLITCCKFTVSDTFTVEFSLDLLGTFYGLYHQEYQCDRYYRWTTWNQINIFISETMTGT